MYVIAAGLAAGIVAWLGGIVLTSWVFTPLFCQATDSIALCATTEFAGTHTATIFAIVVGSIILIRSDIVRHYSLVLQLVWCFGGYSYGDFRRILPRRLWLCFCTQLCTRHYFG